MPTPAPQYPANNPTGTPFGLAANNFNQFMTGQSMLPYLKNLPGYQQMVDQRSENTIDMLQGQVPDDVINQIATQAAERGIAGGAPNSPNANAAYLRSMGLTSLDMMGQGSKELSQSISDTPVPELFNPASLWAPEYTANRELQTAQAAESRARNQARNDAAAEAWRRSSTPDGTYISVGGGTFMPRF
jgi:hypothetical protein